MAESRVAIYGAIAANVAIATTKFIVAAISGSAAMLSEGIHSAVDTGNGVLLLVGTHLSERPASEEHPFGHGKELFFWSLMVAVLIFGIGGGLSLYEGIEHVRHPEPLQDATWSYIVLGAAAVFEGISFGIALKQLRRERRGESLWKSIVASKDPATFTVLAEDGAALLGLVVAAAGVYASHLWNEPAFDGAASIVIGLLLAGVAVLLVRESRGLLIGEGIRPSTAAAIRERALSEPQVVRVGHTRSMYVGRNDVLLTLDLVFETRASADDVARGIAAIKRDVQARFPVIRTISIEPRMLNADSAAQLPSAA